MSFLGQSHHPHELGKSPNEHLIGKTNDDQNSSYIPKGLELVQAHCEFSPGSSFYFFTCW